MGFDGYEVALELVRELPVVENSTTYRLALSFIPCSVSRTSYRRIS
jgi:hypothetical protein